MNLAIARKRVKALAERLRERAADANAEAEGIYWNERRYDDRKARESREKEEDAKALELILSTLGG